MSAIIDGTSGSTFPATISVGGATPSASGAGITFPATQSASSDANTLDDYEEGTWTITDVSGAGLSFTGVDAKYTKIGRQVICYGWFTYPSTANGSGINWGGLPFLPLDTNSGIGVSGYCNKGFQLFLRLNGGTTFTALNVSNGSLVNSGLSGGLIGFQFSYLTST